MPNAQLKIWGTRKLAVSLWAVPLGLVALGFLWWFPGLLIIGGIGLFLDAIIAVVSYNDYRSYRDKDNVDFTILPLCNEQIEFNKKKKMERYRDQCAQALKQVEEMMYDIPKDDIRYPVLKGQQGMLERVVKMTEGDIKLQKEYLTRVRIESKFKAIVGKVDA